MAFVPTTTMGTEFLRFGDDDGPDGTIVGEDGVSSLYGDRPDGRMVHYGTAVRAPSARPSTPSEHSRAPH